MAKLFLLVLIALLVSVSCFSQSFPKEKWVTIKTNIYCTRCKDCSTCFSFLKSESHFIKGIKKFNINYDKQTFRILFNPNKTNITHIRKAISKLGYKADKVPADSLALSKLNLCCKKL